MTSDESINRKKLQVLAVSFTKLLFGILFLVVSIYTHTDLLLKLGEVCNGSIFCVVDFMSGFLLAGAGFFLVSVIIEGVITGYEGIYGAFFNFIGSILLFGAIAAELEAGRWGINAQKIPNLIGGLWTTAGFCIMIGQVSLAWSQKFQGVWIVVSYVISFIGSIFLTAAGAMRTDHVIEKHEDITKYFDTLADIMIAGSIFYVMHIFVYGFALSNYKPDEESRKEDNGGSEIVFPVAPLTRADAEPNPNAV